MRTNSAEVKCLERCGTGGDIDVTLTDGQVLTGFDCVLFAVGRHAVTETLGLETTGVAVEKNGKIRVDDYQSTGVDGLYCVGDAST